MSKRFHEREHARRMLIEWSTIYMQSGDLQEAVLALPMADGKQLEIGLRMSDLSQAAPLPSGRQPELLRG